MGLTGIFVLAVGTTIEVACVSFAPLTPCKLLSTLLNRKDGVQLRGVTFGNAPKFMLFGCSGEGSIEDSGGERRRLPNSKKMGEFGDRVLLTKAACWAHEKEWRLGLAGPARRLIELKFPILHAITLGCHMSEADKNEVIRLNKQRRCPVPIFQAVKKPYEFALDAIAIAL